MSSTRIFLVIEDDLTDGVEPYTVEAISEEEALEAYRYEYRLETGEEPTVGLTVKEVAATQEP